MRRGTVLAAAAVQRKLAGEEGFRTEVLARQELVRNGWQVEYFTFRMTP